MDYRKNFILFTEWIGVNESLSLVSRYNTLRATIKVLMQDMPLEEIWKFYRNREKFYRNISLIVLFLLLLSLYHIFTEFYDYFYQITPLFVVSYICTLPILRTGFRYSDLWNDKSEFLKLIKSVQIDDYEFQKENFWNLKIGKLNELKESQIQTNVDHNSLSLNFRNETICNKLSLKEYRDIPHMLGFVLRSKIDGQEYSLSYGSILNKIEKDLKKVLDGEKEKKAYLNQSLSFETRIQSLMRCENKFNKLSMREVILFFDPLRSTGNCDRKLEKFNWTDEQLITFVASRFVNNDFSNLNFELNKVNKSLISTFFHQFYVYSTAKTGEQKRGNLQRYYKLLKSTYESFPNDRTDNFASTDINLINDHATYRKSVNI